MARVTVVDPISEENGYEGIDSLRELKRALMSFHRGHPNEPLSNNIQLLEVCRKWLGSEDFDPSDPNKINDLYELIDKRIEAEDTAAKLHEEKNTQEFESKSLNAQRLKILLEEYDKHKNLKADELVSEVSKNPAFLGIEKSELQKIIERKIELQKTAENEGLTPVEADLKSDQEILVKETLVEKGIEESKADLIAKKSAEIAFRATSLEDSTQKITGVLLDEKIDDRELVSTVIEATVDKTAEVAVAIKTEAVVDKFIKEIKDSGTILDQNRETKIRELVTDRVEQQIVHSLPKVEEVVTIKKQDSNVPVSTNLAEEVSKVLIDNNKTEVIKQFVREAQRETDGFIENNKEVVGRSRRVETRETIMMELINNGQSVESAEVSAEALANFSYPKTRLGQMVEIDEKSINLAEKDLQGAQLKQASYRARLITRVIMSPNTVRDDINLVIGNDIENNEEVRQMRFAAREIAGNEKAIKSLEYIKGVVNFQKRFDKIVGGTATNLGKLTRIKGLENWGVKIATRMNSMDWENIAGGITRVIGGEGNLGLAVNQLANNLLGFGGNPINWGTKLLGLADGKLLGGAGAKILSSGQIFGKKLGLNALSAFKSMGIKLAPRLAAGLGKLGVGAISGPVGWLLTAASFIDLKEIFKLVTYVIGGVFIGLLVVLPLLTLGPVSSLVPTTGAGLGQDVNEGYVDENGNPIQYTGTGLAGGNLDPTWDCSVADVVTSNRIKQCEGENVSHTIKIISPKTVCNVGCGPASVSMVLTRVDSGLSAANLVDSDYPDITTGGTYISSNQRVLEKYLGGGVQLAGCTTPQEIANYICKGNKAVLVLADFITGGGGVGGHYIMAIGVKNGVIQTKDPYYPDNTQDSNPSLNEFGGDNTRGQVTRIYGCVTIDASVVRSKAK